MAAARIPEDQRVLIRYEKDPDNSDEESIVDGNVHVDVHLAPGGVVRGWSRVCGWLRKLWKVRFRLYRSRILQLYFEFETLFEIYKVCTLLHRTKPTICSFIVFFRNFSVIKYFYSLLGGGGIIMGPVAQPARRRGSGLAAVPWPHSYMKENFYYQKNKHD